MYYLSAYARKVLQIDLIDSLVPRVREAVMDVAKDVANEDGPNDPLLVDLIAQDVILKLAEFLIQGSITTEVNAPILHPRQLRKRHAPKMSLERGMLSPTALGPYLAYKAKYSSSSLRV